MIALLQSMFLMQNFGHEMLSLLDRLSKIEALIQRASSDGERRAAMLAKERILERKDQQPVEYRISLGSHWKKKLFVAICKKHGLSTYRYKGQRYTTARLRVSPALMDEILWPEVEKHARLLEKSVSEIMDNLIHQVHQGDFEEVEIAGEVGCG